MRKCFAVMIAILPITGMVTACNDTKSNGSIPATTTIPDATVEIQNSATVTPGATATVVAEPTVRPSPSAERPKPVATTPAMPPYRPPTVGKPIIPTEPLTPPPAFQDDDEAEDEAAQDADEPVTGPSRSRAAGPHVRDGNRRG